MSSKPLKNPWKEWNVEWRQSAFFSKSVKKSVKRGVRVLRARSARASHARRACEAREEKPTVRFPYSEFVPTRGFKNVVELSKICSQLRPLCEFDRLGCYCERFEPRSHFKSLSLIVGVNVVLNRTVVADSDWRFDNLCGSHLQSQSELFT